MRNAGPSRNIRTPDPATTSRTVSTLLPAPDLDNINHRLAHVDLEQWGPDGVRYVCILFWNELGYRMLSHHFDVQT